MSETIHTPLVKICGIRDPHHALVALDAGADFIGLMFATSPRRVTLEEAKHIAEVVRLADPDKKMRLVGVFANESAQAVNHIAETVGLDMIQLSGDEPAQVVFRIPYPTIGSVRIRHGDWKAAGLRLRDWIMVTPSAVIVDSHVPGKYGGSGTVGDWEIAGQIAQRYRTFLAGGLTPANVAKAIETVKPYAVDVSTGVETLGKKDEDKIRAFIRNAKATTFELPETPQIPLPTMTGPTE
jgi:phosphoribosylanthranilate isomerase